MGTFRGSFGSRGRGKEGKRVSGLIDFELVDE